MNEKKLISVIMAVFNGENIVAEAIESILNQTFKNFEFLIIDDGSSDHSYEIMKKYAEKDNRIRIFNNKYNKGLTKSLNYMIKLANGKYIARQDYDDISLPERLQRQLDFLESNPDFAFCGCDVNLKKYNQNYLKYFDYKQIFKYQIIENCFAHPSVVIKKQIFDKYGYYNEKFQFGQDFELWCRFIYKYKLKARNLRVKLLILDHPIDKIIEKNKQKLIIQMKNQIKTTLKYIRYTKNKFGAINSIVYLLINILYTKLFSKF